MQLRNDFDWLINLIQVIKSILVNSCMYKHVTHCNVQIKTYVK